MHRVGYVVMLVMVVLPPARAQLGQDEAACRRLWGEPSESQPQGPGVRTLRFAPEGLTAEIDLLDNVVRHAVYRKVNLADPDAQQLMEVNGQGLKWASWTSPLGQKPGAPSSYMRSDESAMAQREAGMMSFTSAEWNQRQSAPSSPPPGAATATNRVAQPDAVATNLPAPDVVGKWQHSERGSPAVIVDLRKDGSMSWIALQGAAQREWRGRWQWEPLTREVVLRDYRNPGGPVSGRWFGAFKDEGGLLRYHTISESVTNRPAEIPRGGGDGITFARSSGIVAAKAGSPEQMPAIGDTRERVLAEFGKPTGRMNAGGRAVLMYPWGSVWFEHDVVVQVK